MFDGPSELAALYDRRRELREDIGSVGIGLYFSGVDDTDFMREVVKDELEEMERVNEKILLARKDLSIPEVLLAQVL